MGMAICFRPSSPPAEDAGFLRLGRGLVGGLQTLRKGPNGLRGALNVDAFQGVIISGPSDLLWREPPGGKGPQAAIT